MKKTLLAFMLFCASDLFAQQNLNIKGKISNSKKESLSNATIIVSPGGKTFTSDDKGNFVFQVPSNTDGKITLRVSYSGYAAEEQTIDAANANDVSFVLKSDILSLNDVVIIGNANPKSKLNSSISVSTLKLDDIQKAAPRTTAEIFRSIPGIKAEASGGDGNTNITVRGVPISAGGSKYLQLQEDGLPVLQFGDIAFATSDIFLRADNTLARIEAIRGGSASTMASNSPAGIINFISKTGATEGGSVAVTSGLNYGNFRTDFNYGAPIANGLSFNVGGFYRSGEGPRKAGFNANNGGQLKFNITKNFNKGYVRFYVKHLNDRAAAYMPMPLEVSGTNAKPVYKSLDGFDALNGSLQSPYLPQNYGIGVNGERRNSSVADGMHPVTTSFGTEMSFDLGDDWRVENRTRMAMNSGRFVAPFPANVGGTIDMVALVDSAIRFGSTGATVKYANDGTAYTGTNAMMIHMFDTELNDFNNFVNDLKLKKKFKGGDVTFGFYKSLQNINMSWLWNSYLTDVNGSGLRTLDIYNAAGSKVTQNGLFAYGVPAWGNCCQRSYNTKYDISAPYAAVSLEASKDFTVEASFRWDMGKVTGTYAGAAQSQIDVNGDGIIQATEKSVSSINHAAASIVNYKYNYASYSLGGNYKLNDKSALFIRYSSGYAAKADRLLFTDNILKDGSAKGATDKIDQAEMGYKGNLNNVGLFITAFYAKVNEQGGYEATTQKVIENHYQSAGLEIELAARLTKQIDIRGGLTYTSAKITDGANNGNKPRRQAPFIFNLVPTFTSKNLSIGFSAIGTSSSFAQDDNKLKFKGYVMINPFVNYRFGKSMMASINANNIGNTLGITEAEEGSITEGKSNIIRARSITGRTISATVLFNF